MMPLASRFSSYKRNRCLWWRTKFTLGFWHVTWCIIYSFEENWKWRKSGHCITGAVAKNANADNIDVYEAWSGRQWDPGWELGADRRGDGRPRIPAKTHAAQITGSTNDSLVITLWPQILLGPSLWRQDHISSYPHVPSRQRGWFICIGGCGVHQFSLRLNGKNLTTQEQERCTRVREIILDLEDK